jgi:hypothetical protein
LPESPTPTHAVLAKTFAITSLRVAPVSFALSFSRRKVRHLAAMVGLRTMSARACSLPAMISRTSCEVSGLMRLQLKRVTQSGGRRPAASSASLMSLHASKVCCPASM